LSIRRLSFGSSANEARTPRQLQSARAWEFRISPQHELSEAYNLGSGGAAKLVLDDVENGHFDVSRTGTLVYRRASSGAPALMTVQWVDSIGRKEPLQARPGPYRALSLSPDGKRVALTVAEAAGGRDVWVYDTQRDDMTRLTSGSIVTSPTWSPDAHHVVFLFVGAGIFQAGVDGASAPEILTVGPLLAPSSFPTDGKRLAYVDGKADRFQIWTLPVADHDGHLEAGLPEPFLTTDYSDQSPSFSPDGRWLAYESNESGKSEVYVRAFPPPSPCGRRGKPRREPPESPAQAAAAHQREPA